MALKDISDEDLAYALTELSGASVDAIYIKNLELVNKFLGTKPEYKDYIASLPNSFRVLGPCRVLERENGLYGMDENGKEFRMSLYEFEEFYREVINA